MTIINRIAHMLSGVQAQLVISDVIKVPDVSFWQDNNSTLRKIDFVQMWKMRARAVIIRLGQGAWTDQDYADYWAAARGIFPRGLYWYYDSRYSPGSQAAHIINLITMYGYPEMEVWADYEETYGGPYKGWRHYAVFLAELQKSLPLTQVGVYTGYWYWLDNSPNPITEKASFEWFAQFPLWLAWYVSDPKYVKIPLPWKTCLYWQYTAKEDGLAYGVESLDIDMSLFVGTEDEFEDRYAIFIPDPEPPDPETQFPFLVQVRTNGTNLNVRDSAGGSVITSIKNKITITVFEIVKKEDGYWGRITPDGPEGWVALWLTTWKGIDIPLPPIPVPTTPTLVEGIVAITSVNVRSGPGVTFPISSISVKKNEKIQIISITRDTSWNLWGKLSEGKWCCIKFSGSWYVNLIDEYATFTVPTTGKFYQTVHDYQGSEYDGKPRSISKNYKSDPPYNALPETINLLGCGSGEYIPVTEAWQWFWFELLVRASKGTKSDTELKTAWISLIENYRAFTDFHAPENGFADYVTGRNLSKKPFEMKCLTTGGNLVKEVAKNGTRISIEALDLSSSPPAMDTIWEVKPWLYHWATQETVVKLSDGKYKILPFPQLTPFGTPIPVISLGGVNIIDKTHVLAVENGKEYNIYE